MIKINTLNIWRTEYLQTLLIARTQKYRFLSIIIMQISLIDIYKEPKQEIHLNFRTSFFYFISISAYIISLRMH